MRRAAVLGSAAILVPALLISVSRGDIYRWDTGEVIPGTEGITPQPGVRLDYWNTAARNLGFADFSGTVNLNGASFTGSWLDNADFAGANLSNAFLGSSKLTNADLSGANLTNAYFLGATLTNANLSEANLSRADLIYSTLTRADFSGATVTRAKFYDTTSRGFTEDQLYSTASYQSRDLQGIDLGGNDLTGWNFSGQNLTSAVLGSWHPWSSDFASDLTNADFSGAVLSHANLSFSTLTNADFSGATVTRANFKHLNFDLQLSGGLTEQQLYSTASYRARNLQGIGLASMDLSGWDFRGQNLSHADLSFSALTNADMSGATVTGANLHGAANLLGAAGFTKEQLYSTASYQASNLQGIMLSYNDLRGWNFRGQDLTFASFLVSFLDNADFAGANLYGADFRGAKDLTIDPSAMTRNMIWPNAEILGLEVRSGELLRLTPMSDFGAPAPVIRSSFSIEDGGILSLVAQEYVGGFGFDRLEFLDVSSFHLGGQLRLEFPARALETGKIQSGLCFAVFNWPGPLESTNRFSSVVGPPGWIWDTSRLYTDGCVTLVAIVPEPGSLALTAFMLAISGNRGVVGRRSRNQRSPASRSPSA